LLVIVSQRFATAISGNICRNFTQRWKDGTNVSSFNAHVYFARKDAKPTTITEERLIRPKSEVSTTDYQFYAVQLLFRTNNRSANHKIPCLL
jgi:calcineurin-like phosphoesterase